MTFFRLTGGDLHCIDLPLVVDVHKIERVALVLTPGPMLDDDIGGLHHATGVSALLLLIDVLFQSR